MNKIKVARKTFVKQLLSEYGEKNERRTCYQMLRHKSAYNKH